MNRDIVKRDLAGYKNTWATMGMTKKQSMQTIELQLNEHGMTLIPKPKYLIPIFSKLVLLSSKLFCLNPSTKRQYIL